MKNKITDVKYALDSLSVYRNLLKDMVINKLNTLLKCILEDNIELSTLINNYNDFYFSLINANSVNTFKSYIIKAIIFDENAFSRSSEVKSFDEINSSLKKAAYQDFICLQKIAEISAEDIKAYLKQGHPEWNFERDIIEDLPSWNFSECSVDYPIFEKFKEAESWSACVSDLADFYRKNGIGIFAKYKGFVWEDQGGAGSLKGIESPDPVRLSDLIEYNAEREVVIENTLNFLKGYAANNILLYGDRGTGKSSTVKALLNEYSSHGLRVIELPRTFISDFNKIIRLIKNRPQKFIIFIDDLAFEDSEISYTSLKAILEGGLENRPKNVVIYATSNRRHLIKERFSDLQGDTREEIHESDTIQEKLSLSDRFGITVTFMSPDQNKYIEIVEGIVKNRDLNIDRDTLKKEAIKWEMRYNGRSPRTAKQFVDWLEGKLKF